MRLSARSAGGKAPNASGTGAPPAEGLAFVATDGKRIVGTARLWTISCGAGKPALLLGPVAVAAGYRNRGIGAALVSHAISESRRLRHTAIILVGDAMLLWPLRIFGRKNRGAADVRALRTASPPRP